jgi:endonuclease I
MLHIKSAGATLLLFASLFIGYTLRGQVSDYYKSAVGLSGEQLKTELHNIIDDHIEFPYTSSSKDVWDILKVTDQDTSNPNNVILIYSGRSVDAAQEYNSGSGWTREHVWAKSRGDFGTSKGAGTDVHHLRPLDAGVNSTRNNRSFDNCTSCEEVIDNNFATGSFIDQSQWTFQPPAEVKGDVARMLFYMAVRYEGDNNDQDLELDNSIPGQTEKQPFHGKLETLLQWNDEDPVSDWERNRNEVIFQQFQQNRNPFIDHPELAAYLWGGKANDSWTGSDQETGFIELHDDEFKFWPNPANGSIFFERELSINIYNMLGERVLTTENTKSADIHELDCGLYLLKVSGSSTHKMLIVK